MRKLFVTLLSFAVISANAQTADEVILKYATTMGGLEAFNKVTTAKMTGTLTTQGNVFFRRCRCSVKIARRCCVLRADKWASKRPTV